MNNLFNEQLFHKYLDKIEITEKHKENLTLWNQKLNNGELIAETSNYHHFEKVFLNTLLGYETFTDILADDKEVHGSGKSEFKLKSDDKVFMIIELKGSNVNLDKDRNNKNETPVDQVFRYAKKNEAVPWLLVSNYDEFRLYNYHKGDGKYISWNMKELISDENKLKEFIFVLGKTSYEKGIIDKLVDKTITIQEDFNDEFYKLYSETRLMLIHDLEEQTEDLNRLQAIHYAQLIMDRVIFICFAEDKGLLPEQILEETIYTPIENKNVLRHRIFDRLRELFEDVHEGNPGKKISEYNGGLFKERLWFLNIQDTVENQKEYYKDCYSNWKFESQKNETEKLLGDYKDTINPIYKNFLTMAVFNFDSDVDVNILGHIFESSIGDIEKLKEDNSETRHKFGIHYTPPEITEYICNNTIIPYLSKSGEVNEVPELLSEYQDDVEVLDEKLKNIKILDPACGSGAFLNKAVDVLLEIHEAVWHKKYDNKTTLDKFFDTESERREIILNNIYGVDLNEESTEITKLGLFLKICKKDKKLPSLDNNIKCGNSVIDDPKYAGDKAFKWEGEYKEILDNGGFDIIIGNPPYVRQELFKEDKPYYKEHYDTYTGVADLYVYFFEKGLKLLKKNGYLSYICSNKWIHVKYGLNLRKMILKNNIQKYIDYSGLKIFKDATVDTSTIVIQKNYDLLNKIFVNDNYFINQQNLDYQPWAIEKPEILNLKNKILSKSILIKNIDSVHTFRGITTGCNDAFILDESKSMDLINKDEINKNVIKPVVRGKDITNFKWFNNNYDILFTKRGIDIDKYPSIKEYLLQFKEPLTPRSDEDSKDIKRRKKGDYKWFEIQDTVNYYLEFDKNKIIWQRVCKKPMFLIDESKSYLLDSLAFLITDSLNINYLYSLLNSPIMEWYLKLIGHRYGKTGYLLSNQYVEKFPIKLPKSIDEELMFDNNVITVRIKIKYLNNEIRGFLKWLQGEYHIDKLSQKLEKYYELSFDEFLEEVRKKKVDTKKRAVRENLEDEFNNSLSIIKPLQNEIQELEDDINQKVYKLYDLTDDEIKIIEDSLNE